MIYSWSMEFDIVELGKNGCEARFTVESVLRFDLVELCCRCQSSRRSGLWLIVGVGFDVHGAYGLVLILEPVQVSAAGFFVTALVTKVLLEVTGELLMADPDRLQCLAASLLLRRVQLILCSEFSQQCRDGLRQL